MTFILIVVLAIVVLIALIALFSTFNLIKQYERGVVFRLGKITGVLDPGLHIVAPFINRVEVINLQVSQRGLPPQEVVSNDKVSLKILVVVYYKIVDACKVFNVSDPDDAMQQLAQAIMRRVIGKHSMEEVLNNSDALVQTIADELERDVADWGLEIIRIEIKDIELPEGMRRAMASTAEARQEASAKVIAAQGELDSAALLQQAASYLDPTGLRLRELETWRIIGTDNAAVVVVTGSDHDGSGAATASAAAGQLAAQKVDTVREG